MRPRPVPKPNGACSAALVPNAFNVLERCGLQGAIRHDSASDSGFEHAGVVIIADPEAAPPIRGEDVIRAYSKKSSKDDIPAMMLRGFAAAMEAMLMLGGSSQRLKGHGLSFSPPDPHLSPELRMGVFVCRCNDSLGWAPELDEYLARLTDQPHVVHVETLPSACVAEGTAGMLKTIRQHGLTRVILASCVCCPLDFICSSCTDQRSRLKSALFNATGVSRAMVETCNLRGEVLRLLPQDPGLALERFQGLIERSLGRAARLKSLPSPARRYNFTTAVITDSEATLTSAQALAEAGMEVFLFGSIDRPLEDSLTHRNIQSFPGSTVKRLRGTVGNFQVTIETSGSPTGIPGRRGDPGRTFPSPHTLYTQGGTGAAPGRIVHAEGRGQRHPLFHSRSHLGSRPLSCQSARNQCFRAHQGDRGSHPGGFGHAPWTPAKQRLHRGYRRTPLPGVRPVYSDLPISCGEFCQERGGRLACRGGRSALQGMRQLHRRLSVQRRRLSLS